MTMTKPARFAATSRKTSGQVETNGQAYRDAMARIASAVHVVTTDGRAGRAGLTMTAVASISDNPPMLLVCINRALHSGERLIANGVFCVNVLAAADQGLADDFAGRTGLHLDQRFGRGEWLKLATGAPVLASAISAFDCRVAEVRDVATHHVVVGSVEAVRMGPESSSLAYHNRAYRAV